MRKRSSSVRVSNVKHVSWARLVPKSVIPMTKGSRARVVLDRAGVPIVFVFDTAALLDLLSAIDERLVDRLPDDAYHSKEANPAGWLIDELESRLPLKTACIQSLKASRKSGRISSNEVKRRLGLK